MKKTMILSLASALALTGCTMPRVSRYDEFEKVKVDKMAANDVNLHILSKTIVCLNGMREVRWAEAATNLHVRYVTNAAVTLTTNLTVTRSENQFLSSNTKGAGQTC